MRTNRKTGPTKKKRAPTKPLTKEQKKRLEKFIAERKKLLKNISELEKEKMGFKKIRDHNFYRDEK